MGASVTLWNALQSILFSGMFLYIQCKNRLKSHYKAIQSRLIFHYVIVFNEVLHICTSSTSLKIIVLFYYAWYLLRLLLKHPKSKPIIFIMVALSFVCVGCYYVRWSAINIKLYHLNIKAVCPYCLLWLLFLYNSITNA